MDPPRPEGGPGPGKQQLMCQPSGLTEKPGKTRGFGVEFRRGTRMVLLRLDHITPIGGGRPWRKGSARQGDELGRSNGETGLMGGIVSAKPTGRIAPTSGPAPVVSRAGGKGGGVHREPGGTHRGEC